MALHLYEAQLNQSHFAMKSLSFRFKENKFTCLCSALYRSILTLLEKSPFI